MNEDKLELLLTKAKELEKKYEWLQAAEYYKKTSDLVLKNNDLEKAAELQEQLGYSFYRGARQAQTNIEFKKRLTQCIQAYQKVSKILEKSKVENKQVRINHANSLVAYARSWYETSLLKRKELLAIWWTLENLVLEAHESVGDLNFVGRLCNDLVEMASYNWFWLYSEHSEWERITKELICLAQKAIQIFSKIDDKYELARAYCFASWYYSFSDWLWESEDKIKQLNQQCLDYSNKALQLSQEIGDAWLLSWSYSTANVAARLCDFNPTLARKYGEKAVKYANIVKDNFLLSYGNYNIGNQIIDLAQFLEDPDKQKESFEKALRKIKESTHNSEIINHMIGMIVGYTSHSLALTKIASIEVNPKTKRQILEKATKVIQEGIDRIGDWSIFAGDLVTSLSDNLHLLSKTKSEIKEKRTLLRKALSYARKTINRLKERFPFAYELHGSAYYRLGLMQNDLARIEPDETEKTRILDEAVISIEKCIELMEKKRKVYSRSEWLIGIFGQYYDKLGGIMQQIYFMTKEEKKLNKAIKAYKNATISFRKADLPTYMAESYWHIAQLYDQLGEHQDASKNYELAAQAYDQAQKKIPQLENFYENYSAYMRAWSQIEQARSNHAREDYLQAMEHYKEAASLHEKSENWNYLSPNYYAWEQLEKGEDLSRKEQPSKAIQSFQSAIDYFRKAEDSIKTKIEMLGTEEEKKLATKLVKVADLRRGYCEARIRLEEGKNFDRKGEYTLSSTSYGKAAESLSKIINELESEAEKKELRLIMFLSQAWQKMALAEEQASAEAYLEASQLFEQAKTYSPTKKTTFLILGNSSFCKGLAAGTKYQSSLDLTEHATAKGYMKSAATSYLQAGFKEASEYAKATQRLFDAYVFMSQAEGETDQQKRAKHYQMAENLLQISAGSFVNAKQPEKTAQVRKILENVREEKRLAISLNEVLQAPAIASTTSSFFTPTPTSESSVGLEQFEHANVQANLIAGVREVKVGESFCLTVEFVNVGKEPALLTRVEEVIPLGFVVVKKPEIYRLEDDCLNMKGKQLAPLKLVEAKIVLQPSRKGVYQLKPRVHYLDELGQNKSLQLKPLEIKVEEVVLEDRIATGTKELDSLLLGGIPNGYAVALTGPPSDEREILIRNFLEAGTKEDQTTFYITTEAVSLKPILEKSGFYLFLCNPKPKVKVPDLPNVYKLGSKTDLTNLNIALTKAYRTIKQPTKGSRRAGVEILSDVLLRHGAEVTRRWISELITNMGSKGFTLLAVMNPGMHPPDQANAVLDLFDGEISLFETETATECKRSIRVKRLRNQDYIKNPICLTKPT